MNLFACPLILMSLIAAPPPPQPALVGFMNAERLISHCRPFDGAEPGMEDVCVGYIAGSVDQLMSRQSELPVNRRSICLPPGTTIGQIQRAVIANLEMFEDQPDIAGATIVERTMTAVYPC